MKDVIAGIDLGTTNSEIALLQDGRPRVIAHQGEKVMPSVVGLDREDRIIVGTPARNQLAAFPGRTVRSIKRLMGSGGKVQLGDQEFTPEEISALILKELVCRAEAATGDKVRQVVITVPAFFSDAQRQATRVAGEIAGLEVMRIINEPTAATLAFTGLSGEGEKLLLVYDFGGGTFDASLVLSDGEMTEVLASHGDVRLGGDDFDELLVEELVRRFKAAGNPDPTDDPLRRARLREAAEEAKKQLTEEAFTRVREEFLHLGPGGRGLHLDEEVSRHKFNELITPLVDRTLASVHETLSRAGKEIGQVDEILLVGGSTQVPLVEQQLAELHGSRPRRDLDPHLGVALGAAVQGGLLAGREVDRVLVDVTPYSFGIEHLYEEYGVIYEDCYTPVITAGTPLPVTRSEIFMTVNDKQEKIDVKIYQGESPNAHQNLMVGRFLAEGLSPVPAGNPIACRMTLDLDGILQVAMIEQATGLTKQITITGAVAAYDAEALAASREKVAALQQQAEGGEEVHPVPRHDAPSQPAWAAALKDLLQRGLLVVAGMAEEDQQEFQELARRAEKALAAGDAGAGRKLAAELEDLVHYAEEA